MTLTGSENLTKVEILNALQLPEAGDVNAINDTIKNNLGAIFLESSDNDGMLTQCNGLFIEKQFAVLKSFSQSLVEYYSAIVKDAQFINNPESARAEINDWIASATNNMIKEMIPCGSIDTLTRLVLANAIHFKGSWKTKFDKNSTMKQQFHLLNGKKIELDIMHINENFNFADFRELGCTALRLPFQKHEMLILLPNAIDGLPSLISKIFNASSIQEFEMVLSLNRYSKVKLPVALPRFSLGKTSGPIDCVEVLKKLGMVSAFDEAKADFSGITGNKSLHVSQVLHKSVIEVDEEGAEAAAATAVIMNTRSLLGPSYRFIVDHPFMIFIVSETGYPIFIGHVAQPDPKSA